MARPRAKFPLREDILALADGEGRLPLRATPGARVETLEIAGGKLLAKVRAKAEGGKANEAVIVLVAAALGIAPSRIGLLRGAASREKLLQIEDQAGQRGF